VYERNSSLLSALPAMPDWYLAILGLASVAALGAVWSPLFLVGILAILAAAATIYQAIVAGARAIVPPRRSPTERLKIRTMVAVLHLIQPAARLRGRIRGGLTPWRMRRGGPLRFPRSRQAALWSETWRAPERRVRELAERLEDGGAMVLCGGSFDRWDLEARRGHFGSARLLMAIEDYPHGRQLVRWRYWPRFSVFAVLVTLACAALAVAAARDGAIAAAAVIAACGAGLMIRTLRDAAAATGTIADALAAAATSTEPAAATSTQPPAPIVVTEGSKEPDVAEAALR
jgi:hypothetical protein